MTADAELRNDFNKALEVAYQTQNLAAIIDLLKIKTVFVVALLETQPLAITADQPN